MRHLNQKEFGDLKKMQLNEQLLTETEVAEVLKVSLPCLRRWRRIGTGPRFTRLTRLVRYEPSAVREFVEQHTAPPRAEGTDSQQVEN